MADCDHLFAGIALRVRVDGLVRFNLLMDVADVSRTCTSSMYTVTYDQIMVEFGSSHIVATLGLSFFIWGLGMLFEWAL